MIKRLLEEKQNFYELPYNSEMIYHKKSQILIFLWNEIMVLVKNVKSTTIKKTKKVTISHMYNSSYLKIDCNTVIFISFHIHSYDIAIILLKMYFNLPI